MIVMQKMKKRYIAAILLSGAVLCPASIQAQAEELPAQTVVTENAGDSTENENKPAGQMNSTGSAIAPNFTGVYGGVYYSRGVIKTSERSFFVVHQGFLYRVDRAGNAALYIREDLQKQTYRKQVGDVLYQVSCQSAKTKKYTGWFKGAYYKNGKGFTGWLTRSAKKYYLQDGRPVTGWKKVLKKKYYFNKSGVMQKDCIVGKYYIDESGVCVTDKTTMLAVSLVNKHSDKNDSRAKRLRDCFDYLWQKIPYFRTYSIPGRNDMDDIAYGMMYNKKGNCFCYAATFAHMAKVLGYDARVAVGSVPSRRGGMTPHGWAEININGQWLICDPDMKMNRPVGNYYMVPDAKYPMKKHEVHHRYRLTAKSGKAVWK